jgi:response regulator of citrate/malate metabolism
VINVLVVDDDVQVAQIKAAYIAKVTGFRVTCLAHTAAEAHAARDIATAQAAVWQGAMHYLVKPFTFAGLRSKLEVYAAQHRTFEGGGQAEQSEVDRTFGALGPPRPALPSSPRGIPLPPPIASAPYYAPTLRCPPRASPFRRD